MRSVKGQLVEKYHFLAEAPDADPAGNPAQIRFARKTKEQYVLSEVEGKPTGWKAFYDDGKWVEQIPEKKPKKKKAAAKKKKSAKKKKASAKKSAKKKAARKT